jgi:ribosomal 50S subunit-associated protein YjgA (DUF615 family)
VPAQLSILDLSHRVIEPFANNKFTSILCDAETIKMIKSVHNYSIAQLFDGSTNVIYQVPRYQRPYKWGKKAWDALFDDLLENDPGYFLGSIICINQATDAFKVQELELIDGQQRLTTISLLLAAIYYELWWREETLSEDQKFELMNLRRRLVLKNQEDQPRIVPQVENQNREDYLAVLAEIELVSERDMPPNAGNRLIFKALRHFGDRITELTDNADDPIATVNDLLNRLEQATMVKIDVATHSDAYTLFESINNRGMKLTAVDLIKNKLLAKLDKAEPQKIEHHYKRWSDVIQVIGDGEADGERFLRHFYNAFRDELKSVVNEPLATKANLIRIYEKLIEHDPQELLGRLRTAAKHYQLLLAPEGASESVGVKGAAKALERVQAAPAYMLVLHLLVRKQSLDLTDSHLVQVIRRLVSFFVRRNLTDLPPTRDLTRLFMAILDGISERRILGQAVVDYLVSQLIAASPSDEVFRERLEGPVYLTNTNATRFILCALAEQHMTKETAIDLWQIQGSQYVWTIEHVFPQGENIPKAWVDMIADGDKDLAVELRESHVHKLGNLTISGYNASLGNKTFIQKRDRVDSKKRHVGFRNGLKLNQDLAKAESWSIGQIDKRTTKLADEVMRLFAFD